MCILAFGAERGSRAHILLGQSIFGLRPADSKFAVAETTCDAAAVDARATQVLGLSNTHDFHIH